eukprot:CAMPEP_0196591388 /NCGR_PEP_ID=MMETSP1081-20130531/69418_1 /TAXON_ID=36882 /ORGANISM="Pyramimonas amylifera, Strain CCMP720" /LENGTH=38 /DNA_ID= /DNA_START= /DNA_END= /DNA_ORIENTATION=
MTSGNKLMVQAGANAGFFKWNIPMWEGWNHLLEGQDEG